MKQTIQQQFPGGLGFSRPIVAGLAMVALAISPHVNAVAEGPFECPAERGFVFIERIGPEQHFNTIQDAVDGAIADDIINVCPGTYVEASTHDHIALHVDVPGLTVASLEGAAVTTIDAGGRTNAVIVGGTSNSNTSDSGSITIDGFTVENFTERGISQRWGAGNQIVIRNNVVISDPNATRVGIGIWAGDDSEVSGNTVESGPFFTDSWASAGISAFGSHGALIENNTVTGGDNSINITGGWIVRQAQDNIIRGNTVTNPAGVDRLTHGILLSADTVGTLVENNTISLHDRGFRTVRIGGEDGYPTGTTLIANTFTDTERAIQFSGFGDALDAITFTGPIVAPIRENEFLTGVPIGIANFIEEEIDARGNHWGAASGPLDQKSLADAGERAINNVGGQGSAVGGSGGLIRYWPWLVEAGEALEPTSLVPVSPRVESGDASIVGNPNGNTVYAERDGAPIVIEYSRTPVSVVQREYPPEPGNGSVIDTPLAANRIVNDVDVSDFLKTAVLAEFSQQEVDVDFTVTKSGSATSHVDVTPTSGTISAGTSQEFTFAVGNRRFAGRLRINGVLRNGNPVSSPGADCIGELARDAVCEVTINQQDTVVTFVIGT